MIRDEYELGKGTGVEFYWQTKLPCEQKGQTVGITGARGMATLTAPKPAAAAFNGAAALASLGGRANLLQQMTAFFLEDAPGRLAEMQTHEYLARPHLG